MSFLQVSDSATVSLPNVSLLDQHSELLKQAESMSLVFFILLSIHIESNNF